LELSVSFGQGLQMTNILKDIWDDHERGACWLPRDVFAQAGFDLRELKPGRYHAGFGAGLERLIAIAHQHLRNAVSYTLLIPGSETGLRNFCLWAISMAALTLRNIHRRRDFSAGSQVKISRRSVKAAVLASQVSARSDLLVRLLFRVAGRGLPMAGERTG
ncbi:MAG: squalene/phytoene synthase family protein, partial [Gammaproteobacteria bacterium]|nr:squalene/phytoene synthase family protein [Gammaproteobacteria bacterium]NIR98358.1 squalene/phytoene synthase family protein [Gammaproteobacteria bacterium]NIT64120.1 squalene/phytoene synthase family protein [Gammaproteobacteria bacterium]NIV75247.1 squalene/phytoene synthase family protein [Gammaproteobacteria bacterium]NIY32700.1 squalene/phytoene synthase family protein [Gammaproteobacteria bacterium]